jgi:hypothetical protein
METATALIEKAIVLNSNNAEGFRIGAVIYGYLGQLGRVLINALIGGPLPGENRKGYTQAEFFSV